MVDKSVLRFGIIGSLTVGIDFLVYILLYETVGVSVNVAKGISFIAGALFAYYANRSYTFEIKSKEQRYIKFAVVYLTGLILNVAVNYAGLLLLGDSYYAVLVSFLVSTATSAVYNFLGMKLFVFKDLQDQS